MKTHTHTEQKLVSEGRDLLYSWAVSTASERDRRCRDIAAFLRRLGAELPRASVLPLFVSSAAFAAVMSLARDGRAVQAGQLLDLLDAGAAVGESVEGQRLVAQLRRDLATAYAGNTDDTDGRGFLATMRAVFRLAT